MGTLKTSINITSTDTLPFSVNQTARNTVPTGEFVESGTKLVQPLTSASYAAQDGLVSTRECGANGAYLFAQNPTTNTANIQLFGATDVNTAVSGAQGNFAAITGLEPLATLTPGDSLLLPVPPSQVGVLACTAFGTASLQYYLADRQGQLGQSGIVVTAGPSTYGYAVLDSQAGVLSGGNPTPYFTSLDLNVSSSFLYQLETIVNNKGYALRFTDDLDATHKIYKFINSKGQVAGTVDVTDVGESTYTLDEMGGCVVAYNAEGVFVEHFDGETLYSYEFNGSWGTVRDGWDDCSSDGAIAIEINDYLGNSGDTATIILNKGNSYVVSVLNFGDTDLEVNDMATSYYGNFFLLTEYDDDDGEYDRLQIWSTSGVLLKDLDIQSYNFDSIEYVLYGSNKLQIILNNQNDGVDYLLNYNGATNHLIGHNATNPQLPLLNWTHDNEGDYGNRRFYAYDKYPNDSIRTYNYDWNSGVFDAESMAIVYSDSMNNDSSYHINTNTDYCDIVYVMAGATTYGVHQFANGDTRYIRIPGESGYNRITPSTNLIAFNYSTDTYDEGSLQMLAITPTGVASSSLAAKLEDLNNDNGDIDVIPVGEYVMYRMYNNDTDKTTYTMAKSATRKGSLTLTGTNQSWYRRYNSLILYDYNAEKVWYFNTTTNAFVEVPNAWNWWSEDRGWNNSTTTNGLNDGNQLLYPNSLDTTAEAKMRLLKQGTITAEKQLPVTDGEWDIYLGSEAVFLIYPDMADSNKYKVNVYDLNLNLVKTVPLNTTSISNSEVVGKRCYIRVYNADQLLGANYYGYYMISLEGMAYWLHADSDSIVFNDKWWLNFEYQN